ncbi:hypothetical protein JCM10207_008267 [Rhodosporidiobolus poonsookiae]
MPFFRDVPMSVLTGNGSLLLTLCSLAERMKAHVHDQSPAGFLRHFEQNPRDVILLRNLRVIFEVQHHKKRMWLNEQAWGDKLLRHDERFSADVEHKLKTLAQAFKSPIKKARSRHALSNWQNIKVQKDLEGLMLTLYEIPTRRISDLIAVAAGIVEASW